MKFDTLVEDILVELWNTKTNNPWLRVDDDFITSFAVADVKYNIDIAKKITADLFWDIEHSKKKSKLPIEELKTFLGDNYYELTFKDASIKWDDETKSATGITGSGNAASVFSTVITSVMQLLKGETLLYKEVKELEDPYSFIDNIDTLIKKNVIKNEPLPRITKLVLSARESSRIKLYDRMLSKLTSMAGWNVKTFELQPLKYYILSETL